jgi:hypothetical protein
MAEKLEKSPDRDFAYEERLESADSDVVPSRDIGLGLPPAPVLSPEQEARLWRKIDRRLMPMLALMYLMSFLDRGTPCYLNIQ